MADVMFSSDRASGCKQRTGQTVGALNV